LFDWLHSKRQLFKRPAAKPPPPGFVEPDVFLGDVGNRVSQYLADADQGKLIYPACKRTLSDLDGDAGTVWDHTRLEAMRYALMVPGRDFALLTAPARQIEMMNGYLVARPHGETVIDFTGTASADFAIAILAGLNWMTHCAELAGVPAAQQTGTLRNFRKIVVLAQQWWLTEGAVERCGRMLANSERPPLMLNLIWSEYTRLAKQVTAAAVFGESIDRSAKLIALPAGLISRFEAAKDPGDLSAGRKR
jgi:hypothetical protein